MSCRSSGGPEVSCARARDGGWHGEEERDHSANERRADGANGMSPVTRVIAPVNDTTMIAPITPDPLR